MIKYFLHEKAETQHWHITKLPIHTSNKAVIQYTRTAVTNIHLFSLAPVTVVCKFGAGQVIIINIACLNTHSPLHLHYNTGKSFCRWQEAENSHSLVDQGILLQPTCAESDYMNKNNSPHVTVLQ